MPDRPENRALQPYLRQLEALPFVKGARLVRAPAATGAARFDARVRLRTSTGSHDLSVEVKSSHLGRGIVGQMSELARRAQGPWMLFAPYVGAPLGEALEAAGINFSDKLGNCSLRVGPSSVARIQGRRAPDVPARSKSLRAAGYQVLFALLAEPELVSATVREIAKQAGVSRQPVVDLLARLVEEGYLVRRARKHAWVGRDRALLIDRFVEGYAASLRPKLYVGRYRLPPQDDGPPGVESYVVATLDKAAAAGPPLRFGGTAGAYRLSRHYRGPLTTIHFPFSDRARQRLKASSARDGELVWLEPLGPIGDRGNTDSTVHPLLIYAELLVDSDPRAHEAALRIRPLLRVEGARPR